MVLLHLDNLQLIWHPQQLHVESFCKLKEVRVAFCKKLKTIVPSNSHGHLTNLKSLKVHDCGSLRHIFTASIILGLDQLQEIEVKNCEVRVEFCEKLKTIVPSNSHGLLTFYNLEKLTVENCWSMKSLFPVTIATGLMQLNHLYLFSCGLEKIVSEEEVNGAPRFLFPQLTYIHLENLPKLKCFYSGLHTTEWPMLNNLAVYNCKKIKIYASEFAGFEKKDDGESQPALFPLEKV
ncbi:hypothetical protein Pint_19439 [Pistacia integerrima]|uniref:Uncharacterized protein n=1 Tax=Pistacia integerrima TaxID=434235 RepID=A0ACC0Z143_9ROSI|nr:hypothetical protein Pint_19439 [Pistacia integerrima]